MSYHVNGTMPHKKTKGHPYREGGVKTSRLNKISSQARNHLIPKYNKPIESDGNVVQTPEIYEMVQRGLAVIKPRTALDKLLWESNKSYVLNAGGDRREYHSYPVAKTRGQKLLGLITNKYRPEWTIEYRNGGGSSSGGGTKR